MYVCMYVCMYVGMYVCMYVRTYIRMYVLMYSMHTGMYLHMYEHICIYVSWNSSAISTSEEGALERRYQKLRDCDRKLKNIERLLAITLRWSLDSPQYLAVKRVVESRSRTNCLLKLESLARERWFLLSLKAKYAGIVLSTYLTIHTVLLMFPFRWTGYSLSTIKKYYCYS